MKGNAFQVHDVYCVVSNYVYSYVNQLLCHYNIDCGEGRSAYINLTALDLQGDGNCSYEGMPKCVTSLVYYK